MKAKPRVDVFLSYYRPHISGLTNMAAVLAEDAAADGYDVHVHSVSVTGPAETRTENGVTVHAYKRSFRLARAAFSFQLIRAMWSMRRSGGIAHVHMPYPESFIIAALFAKNWRFISTYQCDAPAGGFVESVIAKALDLSHRALIGRCTMTVTSSADYGRNSRLRDTIAKNGAEAVPATSFDRAGGSPTYRVDGKRVIGFMGRPTGEKGINVLIGAMEKMPLDDVVVLFAGPVSGLTDKLGYDPKRLQALIDAGKVKFVGFLEEEQIKDFYASLDLYVFPSINSFEAFGIVQVEAMSAGIPVVASDLPGVRTVVQETGFGEVTRKDDVDDLLRGLLTALETEYDWPRAKAVLDAVYLPPVPQQAYRRFYERLTTIVSER